jgi:hypothetical protein
MQVVLSFNQRAYETEVAKLNNQIETIKNLSDCFYKIVGKKDISSIAQVHQSIREKSGFQHIPTSAKLLELDKELDYIENNLFSVDLSNFNINNDYLDIQIKKEVLKALKEKFTSYLKSDLVPIYTELDKAIKILNAISPNYYKCIKQNYTGNFEINLLQLNNSDRF